MSEAQKTEAYKPSKELEAALEKWLDSDDGSSSETMAIEEAVSYAKTADDLEYICEYMDDACGSSWRLRKELTIVFDKAKELGIP